MVFSESQIKAIGVAMILFAVFGTVAFYVASYMVPDSIGTFYNESAVLEYPNTTVPAWIPSLYNLIPLGFVVGLMLIGILGGLKVAGVF